MSPTAKKPLIIKVMMKKRILFCNIYKHWTMADWRKVMFCNESTSRLVLRGYKLVRRPSGVSRYDSRYIIKTVKHPKSVMVWRDFSGDKGIEEVYILSIRKLPWEGTAIKGFLIITCCHFGIFVDATTSCRMVILSTGPGLLKSG